MKTQKQRELVDLFLSELEEGDKSVYRDIAVYLSELGYNPKKEKSRISFKHDLHNKQIAKMSIDTHKTKGPSPCFSLRFSACRGYSGRFSDIVGAFIAKYPTRTARCVSDGCDYCKGGALSHVYTHAFPGGDAKYHCGAYALEIPGVTAEDIPELKKLIKEEHGYLLKHEAGIENILP